MDAQASTASHHAEKWSPPSDASDIVKSIHAMLHPRNIVLVGATDKPGNYAERIWNNLIKYKYEGGLFPVNAKRETIWGVPCYKDFASLPEKPDHVLVLVPARFAVQVIRDAAAAGDKLESIPIDMAEVPCAVAVQPLAVGKETKYPYLTDRLMAALRSRTSRERFEKLGFHWQEGKK